MYKIHPFITNDGSVGLYNAKIDDIYHSVTGAAEEAYEKFVLPADIAEILSLNGEIRLLDVCYGVGYNSKIFLNFLLNKKFQSKNFQKCKNVLSEYNYQIDDDNISIAKYNDTIRSDNSKSICSDSLLSHEINLSNNKDELINKKFKISVTAIDSDKTLGYLSPFISPKKFKKFLKNDFRNKKIDKFRNNLANGTFFETQNFANTRRLSDSDYIYNRVINLYLLDYLLEKHPDFLSNKDVNGILSCKEYASYFDDISCRIFEQSKSIRYKNTFLRCLNSFLHNIYYKYISFRYKNDFKALKNLNVDFNMKFDDARNILITSNNTYNIIFLDAFTPSISPTLWTYDFIKLLYDHIEFNGVLVTYTSAAPVRNAMIKAGFHVGRIYNCRKNKYLGTIASKNKALIKNDLSDYELNLLNTKSGIIYRDPNLKASDGEIINCRNQELNLSTLISATELKKQYKL